ncbi:hypothetical protein KZO01_02390 [Kurthia zopfii]|uniref:Uncharacterized protein n=1 Tax=Kurthia zopfii TaxID=1650 RepID=A0A2U3AFG8_9BACL|nr:hypothetical protein [Kurthia zopfii]PWI23270.1 hypothetical protein DF281_03135 [Kurthia zopfii]TDR42131.1 hypothetical protein DFR61_10421 [Kurthia zopfii]STX10950.1 Uncharacterised protein [Kurthia zopfii]VEI05677.1 Uncharacterised protein [Kurthia zopfii]GEK29930.1 hypothetical protein KZO01_02390 [Kurthia zopfii]
MLTFEQKKEIIGRFSELTEKSISMKRVNYHFEGSQFEKTIVVEKLHPNGNGFVYVGDLLAYNADDRGLVNIRDFSEQELIAVIEDAIMYLSEVDEPKAEVVIEESWRNASNDQLLLVEEDPYWNVYHAFNLEESFGTKEDAEAYLREEGFKKSK